MAVQLPVTLTLDEHLPSWNKIWESRHWRLRKGLKDRWKILALAAIQRDAPHATPFEVPVELVVTSYSNRPMDCSNLCVKPVEDALIGRILVDDDPKHVVSVTLRSKKCKKIDQRTIVEIIPCQEGQ